MYVLHCVSNFTAGGNYWNIYHIRLGQQECNENTNIWDKFFTQQCRRVWHLAKCWLMLRVLLKTVAAKMVHITVELCPEWKFCLLCMDVIWYTYCWTADMKYMRRTARYTWTDHKTNTEIAKVLNIATVLDKIQEYKRKWKQDVNRMPHNWLPRII